MEITERERKILLAHYKRILLADIRLNISGKGTRDVEDDNERAKEILAFNEVGRLERKIRESAVSSSEWLLFTDLIATIDQEIKELEKELLES